MTTIKDLLQRVGNIVESSESNTLTEIKNISNTLEVDGKIATVLHFVHKDSSWNPNTLTILEDTLEKLTLNEQYLNQTPEKKQEIKDFYLLNYLDNNWREVLTRKITKYKDHTFMSHWIVKTIEQMIQDIQKLGLYPEIDFKSNPDKSVVEYEDFRQILGDDGTFIYKLVADWIEGIVNQTKNQTLSQPA